MHWIVQMNDLMANIESILLQLFFSTRHSTCLILVSMSMTLLLTWNWIGRHFGYNPFLWCRKIGDNKYAGTTWKIKFQLDSPDTNGTYRLRLALATAHGAELQVWNSLYLLFHRSWSVPSGFWGVGQLRIELNFLLTEVLVSIFTWN